MFYGTMIIYISILIQDNTQKKKKEKKKNQITSSKRH